MHINSEAYKDLFINNSPLMDVRAPVEFNKGAFPTAQNYPIMNDEQRKKVGTCYKHYGRDNAIQKGHELVQGQLRKERIASWLDFAKNHPDGALYCFRGGLRSKITQQWMREAGVDFPIIEGGYKGLRNFLLNELEIAAKQCEFKLIGGKTGSAKTTLINQLDSGLDLEAAAYHRGSSFGRHAKKQNTQINFENTLAIDFLKLRNREITKIVLEDEARTIGKVGIPKPLFEKMRISQLVVIEEPYETRLERLMSEYVVGMLSEYEELFPKDFFASFANYLLQSLEKIKKRLGPVRYTMAHKAMQKALYLHSRTGDITKHYDWLKIILDNYYDPMYEDQLNKRKKFICFRGNYIECKEYLENFSFISQVTEIN